MHLEISLRLDVVGQTNTQATCDARASQALARLTIGRILQATRHQVINQGPAGTTMGPGLFVRLDTKSLLQAEHAVYSVSVLLGQDCIALYNPERRTGRLIGPRADRWGAFDAALFQQPLSEAEAERIDAAMHADKQPRPGQPLVDGYEERRQANAIRLERLYPEYLL